MLSLMGKLRKRVCELNNQFQREYVLEDLNKQLKILKKHFYFLKKFFDSWSEKFHLFYEIDDIKALRNAVEVYEKVVGEYYKAYSIVSDGGNLRGLCKFLEWAEGEIKRDYEKINRAIKTYRTVSQEIEEKIRELGKIEL